MTFQLQKFTVPRADGEVLALPDFEGACAQVAANRRLAASWPAQVEGLEIGRLRTALRAVALDMARQYTASLGVSVPSGDVPLVVTGHQAELFHPGVWIKNAWACRIARALSGVSVNLVVDNDVARHTGLAVPRAGRAPERFSARIEEVLFAARMPFCATEEARADRAQVELFARRVAQLVRGTSMEEPFAVFAGELLRSAHEGRGTVAELVSAARRRMEERFGFFNLELPVGRLSETDEFRSFAAFLIRRADSFARGYNGALAACRAARRIHNVANPLPDLVLQPGKIELPLWAWKKGGPRRRLFAASDALIVEEGEARIECRNARDALRRLGEAGFKVRPRALLLTMFVRLFLADTFIHGVGGANYDRVTDVIIKDFLGIRPPEWVTLSATLLLPLERPRVAASDRSRLLRKIRDLQYQPEKLLSPDAARAEPARTLVEAKKRLIGAPFSRGAQARERYHAFRDINRGLAALISVKPTHLDGELEMVNGLLAADKLLASREFGFPLHRQESLKSIFGLE